MKKFILAALAACVMSQGAFAAFDLQVTEIWPGNVNGDDLTDDWFEVTNVGNMAWTAAVDGDLYYDDDSADETTADLMVGVASIAPGESVIFVDGSNIVGDINTFLWSSEWNTPLTNAGKAIPQVGSYQGSGLSGTNGDAVSLFLDTGFDGADAGDLLSVTAHPSNLNGRSYDVTLGKLTTSTIGVAAGPNNVLEFAYATPGFIPSIPEPGSLALAALGLVGFLGTRRK